MSATNSYARETAVMQLLAEDIPEGLVLKGLTFEQFVKTELPIGLQDDAETVSRKLLLSNIFKKFEGTIPGIDRKRATLESWEEAEKRCFEANYRLNRAPRKILDFLQRVEKRVERILGPVPDGLVRRGRWSNGATFSTRRGVHRSIKTAKVKSVTLAASHLVPYFFRGLPDGCADFEVVGGNKCVRVPKTWKIDRMIASEPTANAFMQQAAGQYIRHRLLVEGVDLNDQRNNQTAAFHALVDDLATVDLSMASDTIAYNLVMMCLPIDWFRFLDSLRSSKTRLEDGTWRVLNKFSSMGNAFTFELESLLFYCIASEIDPGYKPIVYGDDIIIRQKALDDLTACFAFLGLSVNKDKTFGAGSRYFESCGKHYYDLEDVTPVYQKEVLNSDVALMRAHNRLYRWGMRHGMKYVRRALNYLYNEASDLARTCRIPLCERDDGFITHPSLLKVNKNGDFQCFTLSVRQVPVYRGVDDAAAYWYKLYRPDTLNESREGYVARLVETRPKVGKRPSVIWRSSIQDAATFSG